MSRAPTEGEKSNLKNLEKNNSMTIRVGKEKQKQYNDDFAKNIDMKEAHKLFHQRLTMDFLSDLLTVQQDLALKGDPSAIKFFTDRAWGAPPKGRVHVLENLTGVNSLDKLTKAYELGMQSMAEGRLTINEWNEYSKALDSYSSHLERKGIQDLENTIQKLTETMVSICKSVNLNPELVLKELDLEYKDKVKI